MQKIPVMEYIFFEIVLCFFVNPFIYHSKRLVNRAGYLSILVPINEIGHRSEFVDDNELNGSVLLFEIQSFSLLFYVEVIYMDKIFYK